MTLRRIALLAWMTFLGLLGLVLLPSQALAATVPVDPPVALDTDTDTEVFNLSPIVVVAVLSLLIPIVNGLITKLTTSSTVKAVVSLALSIITGLITVGVTDGGGAVISKEAALAAGISFIIQTAAYTGFYKPLGVTSSPVTHVDESGALVTEPGKLANVGVK